MTCRQKSWPRCQRSAVRSAKRWKALRADHAYLLKGDVFTKDQINSYIELKMEDVAR